MGNDGFGKRGGVREDGYVGVGTGGGGGGSREEFLQNRCRLRSGSL